MVKVLVDEFPLGSYPGQKTPGLYVNENLLHAINFIKKATNLHNQLKVIVIAGEPGCGKSTLYTQLARLCDPNFNLSNCHFNVDEWAESVGKKPVDAPLTTESDDEIVDVSARSFNSKSNKKMLIVLARMRSKKIVVFFMLPSFFDLDRTIAMFYTSMVIQCYNHRQIKKGYFNCWLGSNAVRNLYLKGKKTYSYFYPKPNFSGRFVDAFCLDTKDYEQKKQSALAKITNSDLSIMEKKYKCQRDKLIGYLYDNTGLTHEQIGEICNLDRGEICRMLGKRPENPLKTDKM